ncbi:hypothetical protein CMV_021129 [Castanea mollissima]|uniref:UBA domain-containing protein n=1 Tax=Castanea mollissima TaxID=60419 RepID=A0A8J4QWR9_9ROSI|nr:hypothetical protein CMV_021129 [Castanea mollissima]
MATNPFSRCQEASAPSKGALDDLRPTDDFHTRGRNVALFISIFLGSSGQMSYFPLVICEQNLNLFHATQFSKDTCREQGQTAGGGTGSLNNVGLEMMMNMFGGLGAGSLAVPSRSNAPPEELYATQLSQLQEMGFFDTQENIRALIATAGNVHAAVERLLGNSASYICCK